MILNNIFNVLGHIRPSSVAGGIWSLMPIRTNIRNNFPRAKETKRITVHGWKTRMSTPSGRRILMRRILKGRHVLSH
ncbi:39S ribosomal protein L34, mitochondrial [Pseudolycoriella hygida]|uniref:Large ribosomal subunit protein bL34m n=1 Tax=Pseudolycoriella hygida TaxID=35572 RepID=A0A9Q0MSQ5_9DIPT|nr:39S ribosomal protein L34, mitochondrial [Pseudolycoriella hygida]